MKKMTGIGNRTTQLILGFVLAFLWMSVTASAENIRVSYATLSSAYMDQICAMEKGYFREEGLTVEVIRAPGGVATPGLLSGQFQFSTSASSSLSAAVRGGPVRVVYTNLSRPSYSLVAINTNITSAKDLVGKKVAINSFGDTGHLSTILYLRKMGVDPKSILFITVGRNEVRLPALLSGAIDASPLVPRDIVALGNKPHKILVNLGKEIQLVWNGVSTSKKLLDENPQLVERYLRAVVKGREYARRYRDEAIKFIGKHDPSSVEAINVDYDVTKDSMTDEGWLPDDVLRQEVATRSELTKVKSPPEIAAVFDYNIVKKIYGQLKASGWKPTR